MYATGSCDRDGGQGGLKCWRDGSVALCALLLVLLASASHADYLEVSRAATLKAAPSAEAEVVARLEAGTTLALLAGEQTSGYYHAQFSAGQAGWVYRTFVRRYAGEPPAVTSGGAPAPAGEASAGEQGYAARHLKLGKPVVLYERSREGYALAEDGRLKTPLWVQYELSLDELEGPATRGDNFQPDMSIPAPFRSELTDYQGSGYDRGHMAPAADMTRSDQVMRESFLLSNMCPQNQTLNRGLWAQLEDAVRGWVRQRGSLTIISGPVFLSKSGKASYPVIGENAVAVPTHLFKIVVDANRPGDVQALAFLIPNEAPSDHDLGKFLVSIDGIEKATGIDFLSALPDGEEQAVEARVAGGVW